MYAMNDGAPKSRHEPRSEREREHKVRARSAKAGAGGAGVLSPPASSPYLMHNPIDGRFPAAKRMSAISPVLRRTRSSGAGAKAKLMNGFHDGKGTSGSSGLLSKARGASPLLGRKHSQHQQPPDRSNLAGVCTPVLQVPHLLSSPAPNGSAFSPSFPSHKTHGPLLGNARVNYTPPMSPPVGAASPRGPGGKAAAAYHGGSSSASGPARHVDPNAAHGRPSVVHLHNSAASTGSSGQSQGVTVEQTSAPVSHASASSSFASAYAPSPLAKPTSKPAPDGALPSQSPRTPLRRPAGAQLTNTTAASVMASVHGISTPAPQGAAAGLAAKPPAEGMLSPANYSGRAAVLSPQVKGSLHPQSQQSRKSAARPTTPAVPGSGGPALSAFAAFDVLRNTGAAPKGTTAAAPTTPLFSSTSDLLPAKAATQPGHKHGVRPPAPTGLDASPTARKLLFDPDAAKAFHHKASASVGTGAQRHEQAEAAKPREAVPSHISNIECTWSAPGQENQGDYGKGGYLKVQRGDKLHNGRYHVVCKLGWGEFSTVWLCWDEATLAAPGGNATKQFVAVKISKCSTYVLSSTKDEVNLLEYIRDRLGEQRHDAPLATILESFEHKGPHGTHLCMAFPVLGQNMLCLVEQGHRHHQAVLGNSSRGRRTKEDIQFVKDATRSVLDGMRLLEKLHVCHTDLKPENVLLTTVSLKIRKEMRAYQDDLARKGVKWTKQQLVSTAEEYSSQEAGEAPVRVSDFGLSFILSPEYVKNAPSGKQTSNSSKVVIKEPGWALNPLGITMQTREYRAPEILLGASFSCGTDVWSIGCIAYELVTGNFLMDPKKSSGGKPKSEEDINIDHMCMIQQLLGDHANDQDGKYERKYYHRDGRFRYRQRLEKYFTKRRLEHELRPFLSPADAADLASFIHFCLAGANPRQRPSAAECLRHRWLAPARDAGEATTMRRM